MVLIVVNKPEDFSTNIPGVEIITAKKYLTEERFTKLKSVKLFNLCRSYKYQSSGYYVSLLAAARGHKAVPNITTVQDTKNHSLIKVKSYELDDKAREHLKSTPGSEVSLNIYFGKTPNQEFSRLCAELFQLFESPLLKATFAKHSDRWHLHNVDLLSVSDIPENDMDFFQHTATDFLGTKKNYIRKQTTYRYELGILANPDDPIPPSNNIALKRFMNAAESVGICATLLTRDDYSHLAEFDALFIRDTTHVNHYTYRFARRAAIEGLVVIDDPESILKCSNKVYLAEMMKHFSIPAPKTAVINRDNMSTLIDHFSFPFILKQPDSAFSKGVVKVKNLIELESELKKMFEKSDLIIAQEYLPTEFDWRIGIIDKQPLFACKYYMAGKHWQIVTEKAGNYRFGKSETLPLSEVPPNVLSTALNAANLIGDGLYGVDLKEKDGKVYVIEINDNPNIDAGVEDKVLKSNLYQRIIEVFLHRIQKIKNG